MHCKACDRELTEKEVVWNSDLDDWELCTVCLDVALDAAFSQGFSIEEDSGLVVDGDFDETIDYSQYNWLGERISHGTDEFGSGSA